MTSLVLGHYRRFSPICACAALAFCGCRSSSASRSSDAGVAAVASSSAPMPVDHGELDTKPPDNAPKLASTVIAATVYKLPNIDSRKLGYIRLGGSVKRDPEPVRGVGCKGRWYHVYPMGYVCSDEATTELDTPLVRASSRRPDLNKPLPYRYGFVRATSPQYLRIPTKDEQLKSEFKLEEHLAWYRDNEAEVQKVVLGANDLLLDTRGIARRGAAPPPSFRPSTAQSRAELFGADSPSDPVPFWLEGGRKIPNVSGFDVPEYAVFADRVRRKTGLSFVGAFSTKDGDLERQFAITVDLRLIPTTKVKPDTGSPFHGIEIGPELSLPFGWVIKSDSKTYKLIKNKDEVKPAEDVPKRVIVPLTGNARIKAGKRYYQTLKDKQRWLLADDLGVVDKPASWPEAAEKGLKWIDISLRQQTLTLYEGKRPWYSTLVSTGRDRLGDPKTSLSTPQGTFNLKSKHIAAAMDSEENSSVSGGTRANTGATRSRDADETAERLERAAAKGEELDEDDQRRLANIKKGRDPEYGVTVRRGAAGFELRDVPWIQYFAAGYALHGAYWHDVFGIPRSHGCVNLAPIDARIVFMWTDPPVPEGWHGINVGSDMGEGTTVVIRE
jgi:hypothetical protein